jgi:hypothetical protein
MWSVLMIGQMLNVVLPGRAGEVGRIYYVGRGGEVSRAQALSTIITEKLVDLVMLAGAYLLVAYWLSTAPGTTPDWVQSAGTVLLPVAALALCGLLLLAYAGRAIWQSVRRRFYPLAIRGVSGCAHKDVAEVAGRGVQCGDARLPIWMTAADQTIDRAIAGFEALRRPQTSLRVWSLSVSIWALGTLTNYALFQAFGLSLSLWVALFLLVVLMSGVAVPPLPGNLGVMPYLCQVVLSIYGVDRETALLYGLVLQVVVNLPLILLGSGCLVWENVWVKQ